MRHSDRDLRTTWKLAELFDAPNPPGTYRRINEADKRRKSHAERRQINERRKQAVKARCTR